jgi:hypothetical protein
MGEFRSVTEYAAGDFIVIMMLRALFIIGCIGYSAVLDIKRNRSLKKLSVHTKLVLLMTLILNLLGTIFIFALEYHNTGTLGNLSLNDKLLGAYFHGVVPRTAGFNSPNTWCNIFGCFIQYYVLVIIIKKQDRDGLTILFYLLKLINFSRGFFFLSVTFISFREILSWFSNIHFCSSFLSLHWVW